MNAVLEPKAGDCYVVLKLVKYLRRSILCNKAAEAGLAGFWLGRKVTIFKFRPIAKDAYRGMATLKGSRAGAIANKALKALDGLEVALIYRRYSQMHKSNPRISMARASERISERDFNGRIKPRTIRRYLSEFKKARRKLA